MGTGASTNLTLRSREQLQLQNFQQRRHELAASNVTLIDKENNNVLHRVFSNLDPAMSLHLEKCHGGQIQITVNFNRNVECLQVTIHRARNIYPKNMCANSVDTFVKISLCPKTCPEMTERQTTSFATSIVYNKADPIFEELFMFESVSADVLAHWQLKLELWDHSVLLQHGELLGRCFVQLNNLKRRSLKRSWYSLMPLIHDVTGTLSYTLCYEAPGFLSLNNLIMRNNNDVTRVKSILCRIFLTQQRNFTETTDAFYDSVNQRVQWLDKIYLKIRQEDMKNMSLLVTVFGIGEDGNRCLIGQTLFHLNKQIIHELTEAQSITLQLRHLNATLEQSRKELEHATLLNELKNAYVAHYVAKYPFGVIDTFGEYQNKKVTLRCRQAGCNSICLLVDGVLQNSS